ncbi:MAG: hypothetical protein JWM27_3059 [Gemmatimonadetes bacterium]|nr:hypothetical protein [Gemmatimonadota bacterium]
MPRLTPAANRGADHTPRVEVRRSNRDPFRRTKPAVLTLSRLRERMPALRQPQPGTVRHCTSLSSDVSTSAAVPSIRRGIASK